MFSKTSKHRFKTPYIIENNDKKTPIFTSSPPKIHYPMNLPPSSVTQPTDVVPRSPLSHLFHCDCHTCSTYCCHTCSIGYCHTCTTEYCHTCATAMEQLWQVPLSHSFPFKNCSESMDFTQVSFIPIQARSKVLWTYVQAPSGRTSLPPQDVRP